MQNFTLRILSYKALSSFVLKQYAAMCKSLETTCTRQHQKRQHFFMSSLQREKRLTAGTDIQMSKDHYFNRLMFIPKLFIDTKTQTKTEVSTWKSVQMFTRACSSRTSLLISSQLLSCSWSRSAVYKVQVGTQDFPNAKYIWDMTIRRLWDNTLSTQFSDIELLLMSIEEKESIG